MYKIKLFRNMGGFAAGKSLKQTLTNRDWWKGVFGNMLSTIIGICLTIGVAAIVEHHNDKKQARELMFSIVKTCEDNGRVVAEYDSLLTEHMNAAMYLINLYNSTDKFANITSTEQNDSLAICLGQLLNMVNIKFPDPQMENTFNGAQTLHQIGNQEVYSKFSHFLQMDKEIYDKIQNVLKVWVELRIDIQIQVAVDKEDQWVFMRKLVEEHKMADYAYRISMATLSGDVEIYKQYKKILLAYMDADEEDYEEYKKGFDEVHDKVAKRAKSQRKKAKVAKNAKF